MRARRTPAEIGRRGRRVVLVALLLVPACGGSKDTRGKLTLSHPAPDTVELRGDWKYDSVEVDVKLTLISRTGPDGCTSIGTLSVDQALGSTMHYDLAPTDCSELELTDDGDIVLDGDPTRHDWTSESLSVDTGKKLITLGPVKLTDADGNAVSYSFTLSSPPCADGSGCSCGLLRRIAGSANTDLSLGRRC
jgi:hypothetical protein